MQCSSMGDRDSNPPPRNGFQMFQQQRWSSGGTGREGVQGSCYGDPWREIEQEFSQGGADDAEAHQGGADEAEAHQGGTEAQQGGADEAEAHQGRTEAHQGIADETHQGGADGAPQGRADAAET